ncbi:DNA-binding protein BIN4 [Prosopis cineraria]|uniref:DNA-binding protein BIN4 n=1 Tax=Prosopis cineraria TaxID=364024 RepID=UPI00240ED0CB|nr:DNA-binding protein BIN4 [Prosopis cineraria]
MTDSRESSPDWLRSFKVPTDSPLTISSNSGSLQDDSPSVEDKAVRGESFLKSSTFSEIAKKETTGPGKSCAESLPRRTVEAVSRTPSRRKKGDNEKIEGDGKKRKAMNEPNNGKYIKHNESIHSVWTLSSDSESCDHSQKWEDRINEQETYACQKLEFLGEEKCGDEVLIGKDGKSPSKKESEEKLPQKQIHQDDHTPHNTRSTKGGAKGKGSGEDAEVKEERTSEKHVEPHVYSGLPLILSEKVHRTKALIECEGDSIDLSGDIGAVGRIMISDSPSGDQEMYFDLKGTIYKTAIIPSRTFCVVSFGQSEAKIEAIMNDFIQLKPQSNVYEAETMVEGTLDGFSFDSDEETDKLPKGSQTDQNEHDEEQTNKKANGKTDKTTGAAKKRGRGAGGKPPAPKKTRKKAQGSKKPKAKK